MSGTARVKRIKNTGEPRFRKKADTPERMGRMAESWGFEPQIPFWGIHA